MYTRQNDTNRNPSKLLFFTVECLAVDGDPWFKGVTVATSLGYLRPCDTVYDHVPHKFKRHEHYCLLRPASLKCRRWTQTTGK